ncbi:hypothetical protein LIA77_11780 [Sarocladium implicatum]|nr:hypothetical protein LIA77_11780 [Sarocladium implicatum]
MAKTKNQGLLMIEFLRLTRESPAYSRRTFQDPKGQRTKTWGSPDLRPDLTAASGSEQPDSELGIPDQNHDSPLYPALDGLITDLPQIKIWVTERRRPINQYGPSRKLLYTSDDETQGSHACMPRKGEEFEMAATLP